MTLVIPPKIFSIELEYSSLMVFHLQAVHSGADLESAIANCMGYKTEVMLSTGNFVLLLCNFILDGSYFSSGRRLYGWSPDKSCIRLAIWLSGSTSQPASYLCVADSRIDSCHINPSNRTSSILS